MELHHSKHHQVSYFSQTWLQILKLKFQAYVTNYNAAQEQLQDATSKGDASKIIQLGGALKFNGGGHINHSIFWQNLSPYSSAPSADLAAAIQRDFKDLNNLKNELKVAAVGVQGSGWAWLGLNKKTGRLQVAQCANQDPLEATTGLVPLFGIDVWEHAYYLQYKNLRPNYIDAIWDIVNWKDVSDRLARAK